MAQENENRVHAAISLGYLVPGAAPLQVLASSGVELASIIQIVAGVYIVRLTEGIADSELAIAARSGRRGGALPAVPVLPIVVRPEQVGQPADPELRTFILNTQEVTGDPGQLVNAEGEISVVWLRIAEPIPPFPVPGP